jgi:hypothetical protein
MQKENITPSQSNMRTEQVARVLADSLTRFSSQDQGAFGKSCAQEWNGLSSSVQERIVKLELEVKDLHAALASSKADNREDPRTRPLILGFLEIPCPACITISISQKQKKIYAYELGAYTSMSPSSRKYYLLAPVCDALAAQGG